MSAGFFSNTTRIFPVNSDAEQGLVTPHPIPVVEHKEVESEQPEGSLFREMSYKEAWKVLSEAVNILVTFDDNGDYCDPTMYDQYSKTVLSSVDSLRKGTGHYPCFRGASHRKTAIEDTIEKLRLLLLPEKQHDGSLVYRTSVLKKWHEKAVELRANLAQCAPKKSSCCSKLGGFS